ncbi:SDR family NAD(P)-dependent oxidoreductase [Ferruginivarius sediminum]|uniref:SDR family NAD(P)-dependent oxidoreductase n=1 Tax=Ferruginivarius sediminum TaxID=2661937 RepID=A0A369TA95_9PROT|nr:SDR family NAD(P)-dependent oxidoreductase [Ferruginivarius sediminum]RDD61782.1 SDR family NAD(P)-dependent oxidoreductase [Ferruginivarius sediminum]
MRLENKVAVITGAARGIGQAIAQCFAGEGAKVVLADVEETQGERAVEEIQAAGGEAVFVPCDVGDKAQVDALIERAVAAYGRVDCVVANAAIVVASDFLELSEADFDKVIRVNLKGVFLTGQAAARQMVKQGTGGTIINMSSVNAVMAIPTIAPYVVAKGGINQLTKVEALALADHGIRANAIGPGSIGTEMVRQVNDDPQKWRALMSRTPMGRLGEPEEVAKVALFLASDDSSYLTGQCIYPDGGRLALNYTVPVKE